MIEHKRWKRFKQIRRARISLYILVGVLFFSCTAEFWANNKPLVMKFDGAYYVPVLKTYYPTDFKQEGFVTNYRALKPEWAIWPLIKWDPFEANSALLNFPGEPSVDNWM